MSMPQSSICSAAHLGTSKHGAGGGETTHRQLACSQQREANCRIEIIKPWNPISPTALRQHPQNSKWSWCTFYRKVEAAALRRQSSLYKEASSTRLPQSPEHSGVTEASSTKKKVSLCSPLRAHFLQNKGCVPVTWGQHSWLLLIFK